MRETGKKRVKTGKRLVSGSRVRLAMEEDMGKGTPEYKRRKRYGSQKAGSEREMQTVKYLAPIVL